MTGGDTVEVWAVQPPASTVTEVAATTASTSSSAENPRLLDRLARDDGGQLAGVAGVDLHAARRAPDSPAVTALRMRLRALYGTVAPPVGQHGERAGAGTAGVVI